MKIVKRMGPGLLIGGCLLMANLPAQAGMVATSQFNQGIGAHGVKVTSLTQQREWVKTQLQMYGVSAADAVLRVNNLTDNQVLKIHQKMDQLPAGASAGGLILTVFLVLLVTDIAGYTDVFPFVRPVD